MDASKFDEFARRLVRGQGSRRSFMKWATALFAGGGTALALELEEGAAVTCRDNNSVCLSAQNCCSNYCAPPDNTGRRRCQCGDLQVDPNNCGACGNVCAADKTCSAGACTCSSTYETSCVAGSYWDASSCRCVCDGSDPTCDPLFATYETQCGIDPISGDALHPAACDLYWAQLSDADKGRIETGYEVTSEEDNGSEDVQDYEVYADQAEFIAQGYTCGTKSHSYTAHTTLYFTAYRYYLQTRFCWNGSRVTSPQSILSYYNHVNATFKIDNNWGGPGQQFKVLENYRMDDQNWVVKTQGHIENCLTKYGCTFNYYPWIKVDCSSTGGYTVLGKGRS